MSLPSHGFQQGQYYDAPVSIIAVTDNPLGHPSSLNTESSCLIP